MKYPTLGGVIGAVTGFVGFFAFNAINNAIQGLPPFLILQDLWGEPRYLPFVLMLAGMSSAVCAAIGFVAGFLWWAWVERARRKIWDRSGS
jgi:hypothetical protein